MRVALSPPEELRRAGSSATALGAATRRTRSRLDLRQADAEPFIYLSAVLAYSGGLRAEQPRTSDLDADVILRDTLPHPDHLATL